MQCLPSDLRLAVLRQKYTRWQRTEEEIRSAALMVGELHFRIEYRLPTQDNFEKQNQLAHDRLLVSEKEHKQALRDFRSSFSETLALMGRCKHTYVPVEA